MNPIFIQDAIRVSFLFLLSPNLPVFRPLPTGLLNVTGFCLPGYARIRIRGPRYIVDAVLPRAYIPCRRFTRQHGGDLLLCPLGRLTPLSLRVLLLPRMLWRILFWKTPMYTILLLRGLVSCLFPLLLQLLRHKRWIPWAQSHCLLILSPPMTPQQMLLILLPLFRVFLYPRQLHLLTHSLRKSQGRMPLSPLGFQVDHGHNRPLPTGTLRLPDTMDARIFHWQPH